jgi:hypothetical protein
MRYEKRILDIYLEKLKNKLIDCMQVKNNLEKNEKMIMIFFKD